jgi:hypothetical protein
MSILKWIIIILATLNFGYMTYYGSRALMMGSDMQTPIGEYAGNTCSWQDVVSVVGIVPGSTLMNYIFLIWGSLGLIIMVSYAMEVRNAQKALLIINVLSLWYLLPGTIISMLQIVLLFILRNKK